MTTKLKQQESVVKETLPGVCSDATATIFMISSPISLPL